jgi:ferrous iron transport protein A
MIINPRKLSDIKKGESVVVDSFTDDCMKLKLLEMGCLPGEVITVDRLAPFGDPMAITVSGCSTISLRMDEAANVLVK